MMDALEVLNGRYLVQECCSCGASFEAHPHSFAVICEHCVNQEAERADSL